jgi:hypothetical protein
MLPDCLSLARPGIASQRAAAGGACGTRSPARTGRAHLLQKARSNRSAGQAKVLTLGRGRRAPAGGAKPPADAGKHVQGIARLERRLDQDDVRLLGPVLGIKALGQARRRRLGELQEAVQLAWPALCLLDLLPAGRPDAVSGAGAGRRGLAALAKRFAIEVRDADGAVARCKRFHVCRQARRRWRATSEPDGVGARTRRYDSGPPGRA